MALSVGAGGLIANRYRLGAQLGRGGMGQVYQAYDQVLGRDVAVKLLDEGACADAEVGQACAEEALLAARLSHPGIASIFDSGVHEGYAFVVMELVAGRPLDQIIHNGPRPAPIEAAALAARVADALAYAHQQGVVHCDVKPQNIILTPEGQPKLVDFGIARVMTTTGSLGPEELRGSAPYVSPEQVRGERVDGRADVYALGAVLYELLTGRPPFQGATVIAILGQHLAGTAPLPRSLNPNVSVGLERVVLTALARNPSQRYATAGAFRDALEGVVQGERAAAQARTERVEPLRSRPTVIRGRPRGRFFRAFGPSISKMALAAVGVAVLLAGLLLLLALARPSVTAAPAPTPGIGTDSTPPPSSVPTVAPTPTPPLTPTTQPSAPSAPVAPAAAPVPPSKPNGQGKPDGQSEQVREEQKKAEERAREDQKKQEERAREEQKKAEERERDKRGRGN
ncbi:MAG TPA: protein kinase [Chloroflexota bacterium]|nr:protein kinase [Chloroflexota bacterium]